MLLAQTTPGTAGKIYKWLDGKGSPGYEDGVKMKKWAESNLEKIPKKRYEKNASVAKVVELEDSFSMVNEDDPNAKPTLSDILFQQNKLLITLQQQSVALQQQSITSNNILKRLADNVEVKVERIDVNVSDTLGKVNKIVSHLSGANFRKNQS